MQCLVDEGHEPFQRRPIAMNLSHIVRHVQRISEEFHLTGCLMGYCTDIDFATNRR